MSNFEQTCTENKTIITKYFTIEPRFLLITQKQKKTDFWTTLASDDQKIFFANSYRITESKIITN